MRAVVLTKPGRPEVLEVQERPDPRPGPHDVRIQVAAAGVNFADLMARIGLYPDAPMISVKAPVFSFPKLTGVDINLGPEMKSTGEIMGIDTDFGAENVTS